MKTETIVVANLKCSGCATTIKQELCKISSVLNVEVDIERDTVNVQHSHVERKKIVEKLHSLGYPEATEENGLLLQLKSFTSCMAGRINNL